MSQLPTHCAPLYGEAGICPGCAIALLQIINGLDAALKAALEALAYAANNARERLESLDDWEQEDRERWYREDVHSAAALAACREAMK